MIQIFYMLFTIKKIDTDFSKWHFLELSSECSETVKLMKVKMLSESPTGPCTVSNPSQKRRHALVQHEVQSMAAAEWG